MFLASVLLVLASDRCPALGSVWPKMMEFSDSFAVETSAEKIEFVRPLYDLGGTVRYTLVCIGGSQKYLDSLSTETDINYVGVLGCRLSEGGQERGYSLLAEDDSAPWHTRGQFHSFDEVVGDCGSYPEYGSVRHFRLRGFELTLSAIDHAHDASNQLQSFRMHVSLKRDDRVASSRTEQPGYLPPYRNGSDCKTIRKGNATRMCRNWEKGGSWGACTD